MTQTHQSLKAKLLRLQNLLASDSKPQATSSAVQQLTQLFRKLDIKNEKVAKQVYEEARETVKGVLGLAEKCKYPLQCMSVLQKLIRELLLAISNFCSLFYCIYHPNGCGDMVKEFLASDCRLFVPEFAAPLNRNPPLAESQTQQGTPAWLWARQTGFKTLFFSECVQTIMRNLVHFQQRFGEMPVSVIGQYLRLLYYIEDHVVQQKLINLCLQHVEALQQLFTSPSKQTMKDANKEKLEQIVQHLTKLLRHSKNDQAKKRVQLLGALLGMSMLKLHSIEKKIVGCKIVSKFAYEMLYRNTSYITEASFCEWVVAQGFFALVFEDNCQTSLVKACEDTFKLLVKKSNLKKEQFQRFFQILEKSQLDLRKAMFRLIDPFRVDYYQIQTMLEIFKTLRGAEFYDDQFFYFLQGLSRYSTQLQITSMLAIIESIISQHYGRFESYLTKRRSVECYSYVFQRLITYKEPEQRIGSYVKVAEDFVSGPSLNKLIMLKTLFQNLTEHKMDRSMQQTLCDKIILQVKFIEKSLKLISQPTYKGDLITTIKIMLKKYGMRFNKQPFTVASLVQCVGYPEIFEEMLKLINSSEEQQLQGLFEQLANLTTLQDFSFSCVKSVFIKLNLKNLRPVKKQYTDVICTYVTYFNPASFLGLQTLKYLIFNSKKPSIRQGASQLLVEIYTNLSDDFREQGQVYLVEFMKSIVLLIRHKFKQFLEKASEINSVKGSLELIEELLLNTEYFGVGSLKAHNSLIPTSTVSLKVFNNSTYGDDVLKIFQKKFPSNKTLFDVIAQVSKQFKIGPLDICLEFPNASSIKYNGLTLQELKLNKQELNAIKLPQSRVKKQPLLLDGALSPRAVKVFTDMFNKYAPNGKMSSKECAKYIEGVTLSFCPTFDSRITSFFAQYDADKDGILLLQDFIKFYKESLLDPEKAEVVEKNLANLRYRRDLKLYDQPIDSLNQEVIFRYHIWNNKEIYDYLFKFTNNQDSDICSAAQALLLRLPTYPKMAESLAQQLNLKEKKPFEVEYLLTTLESQIVSDSSVSQKLIKSRNHLAIFEYLSQLCSKQVKITNQKNCLIISLHLLHSLLGLKKESEGLLLQFPKLAFDLPKTQVFLNIIRESIKTGESTLLQPAFSLQLTQNQMPFDWIQESAFNKDKDTRYLTCGFLYLWTLKNKSKDLNLFKIKINQTRNQQWFNFLALIMSIGIQIDYLQLFTSKITQISSLSQSLEGLRFNPIIHGNLKLIKELYYRLQTKQKDILYTTLTALMPSLISNQNRELAYQLMLRDYPLQTLAILQTIAGVKIGKEAQPRNKFVGIKNLGCICYMNSILQQFFMIKQFLALITQLQPNTQEAQINGITIIDDFLYQLQSLYLHLQWSQKQYYDPTKFCLTIKDGQGKPVNTHIQEDAHQFLNTAFDKIETYAKKQEKQKILQKIFGGKTVTEIICQSCKNKVQVLEHFHHLTVEVKGMKTLKESFDKLITAEQISDYFCVNCDKRVQKITKQTLIKQAPEILIINLQRIIFDLQTFLKVKVHTKLQFEQTLDLHNYFSSSTKPAPYKLKGVVIHSGTSEGGHYYSLIKQDGKWYKFNDQSVTAFNQIDLGRQAFGGQEQTDTLGDFTSSNNAYILMYEKATSPDELQPQESKPLLNKQMYQQVLKQNREFKAQLQMYQASFFATLNTLFQKYIDQKDTNVLVTLFDIHLKVIQDLSVNSDVKTQTISQIKENFLKLCSVLPQRTKAITQVIDKASFGELICANNDVNIRQVYSKVLAKVLTTSVQSESSQLSEQSKLVVLHVISLLESDLLVKNIFKSLQFFQLCKELANLKQIKAIMLESGCLDKLLDLLLGSDSVHSTKQKKRSEFSPSEATPVVSVITTLLKDKVNLLGHRKDKLQGQKYYELTDRQKKIFNDPQFYRKMMRNKLDMGLIFAIIELLCYKDENYSKFIIQVLLKAMNNNDEIQDKSVVFANLKAFLLTEDQLWEQRLKWGLGVAQLDSISSSRHQFGMMTSAQSKVYSYVSALLFVKEEKVMPLLSSLFDKRKYYNSFSVHGILSLLQLMSQSKRVLAYILSLPAPTYIHKTYLDWIDAFATKIRNEQHYNLPYSKDLLSQKFSRLAEAYRQDLHRLAIADAIPVNKWIIGKNAAVVQKDSIVAQTYSITLQQHQTYVLKNRPYGLGNFQLPDHEFAFSSTSEKTSRYFLKSVELLAKEADQLAQQKVFQRAFEGTQKGIQGTQKVTQGTQKVTQGTQKVTQGTQKGIQKQWTVLTFSIKCSIPMEIKFKMQHFQHTIHLKTGESTVYCPYEQGNLAQLIQITVREQELEAAAEIQSQPGKAEAMSSQAKGYSGAADYDYFSTIEVYCSYCSHLNFGVYQCVACDTDLFK